MDFAIDQYTDVADEEKGIIINAKSVSNGEQIPLTTLELQWDHYTLRS